MIKVSQLSKFYGQHRALSELSFSLSGGDVLGILGPNGSGKTTLFRLLLGLIQPSDGEIILPDNHKRSLVLGYLPEERSVYKDISVIEQITYLARLKKMKPKLIERELNYWFYRFNMNNLKHHLIRELSKGNQQKVQFICALIHKPKILILDEPLTGLDAANVTLFKQVILEQSKMGRAILLSSHQYEEIETFCNQVILLNKGETFMKGDLRELKLNDGRVVVTLDEDKFLQYKDLEGLIDIRKEGNYTIYTFENRYYAEMLVSQAINPTCKIEPIGLRRLVEEKV